MRAAFLNKVKIERNLLIVLSIYTATGVDFRNWWQNMSKVISVPITKERPSTEVSQALVVLHNNAKNTLSHENKFI